MCAIASILLGVAGWLVTSFFAKPLLDFLNLRSQVHEEVIFTANVGPMAKDTPAYEKAEESLRRLGAKMHAANETTSSLLRWFLSKFGYDLAKASGGLIGLANSLDTNETWERAVQINSIQVGLRLRRDYNDERLRLLESKMQRRYGA